MVRQGGHTLVRGLVVLCLVILLAVLAAGCGADVTGGAPATENPYPLIGQQVHTLDTATPTGTPKPRIKEDAAVLGGAVYAFDNQFGSGTCCDHQNGWDHQGPSGVLWTGVWYDGYISGDIDEQSKARVNMVANTGIQLTEAQWTVSQADAICNPYMPPDAQYKGTTTAKDVTGLAIGTEKWYISALLANTLPASDFKDVNGNVVTPGTFYLYESAVPDMPVTACTLSTDEYYGQNL